jgi:hypothetical protein
MKLPKTDEKLILNLSKTKTVRELGRVLLSYMTVEEMAKFVSIYMVLKSKDLEHEVINYFTHDQFMPLVKMFTLSLGDLLPDFLTDKDFMKLYNKLPKKISFTKTD